MIATVVQENLIARDFLAGTDLDLFGSDDFAQALIQEALGPRPGKGGGGLDIARAFMAAKAMPGPIDVDRNILAGIANRFGICQRDRVITITVMQLHRAGEGGVQIGGDAGAIPAACRLKHRAA